MLIFCLYRLFSEFVGSLPLSDLASTSTAYLPSIEVNRLLLGILLHKLLLHLKELLELLLVDLLVQWHRYELLVLRGVRPVVVLYQPVFVLRTLWRTYHVVVGGAEIHRLVYTDAPRLCVSHSMYLLCKSLYMLLLRGNVSRFVEGMREYSIHSIVG